jgi:hypothetical protein
MDGTVPHFYFKAASTQAADKPRHWLIFREEGPVCHDEESCDKMVAAYPEYTSSKDWPDQIQVGGIFSSDETNSMADYNKVYIKYCSGDSYISDHFDDVKGEKHWGKYYMNGFSNTYAVHDKLAKDYGLGQHRGGENVVIGGSGVGALGAMYWLDHGARWKWIDEFNGH